MPINKENPPRKPTPEEIRAANGKTVPDVIAPGLRILFCGINPGLYTAAVGHHFARPGNRFWPALHASGLTPTRLHAYQERQIIDLGLGITNLVPRATAAAAELSDEELEQGGKVLVEKIERFYPRALAVLGVSAYRSAFKQPKASVGPQPERLGETLVWVLPNPSGLNAHYQLADLASLFRELGDAVR